MRTALPRVSRPNKRTSAKAGDTQGKTRGVRTARAIASTRLHGWRTSTQARSGNDWGRTKTLAQTKNH